MKWFRRLHKSASTTYVKLIHSGVHGECVIRNCSHALFYYDFLRHESETRVQIRVLVLPCQTPTKSSSVTIARNQPTPLSRAMCGKLTDQCCLWRVWHSYFFHLEVPTLLNVGSVVKCLNRTNHQCYWCKWVILNCWMWSFSLYGHFPCAIPEWMDCVCVFGFFSDVFWWEHAFTLSLICLTLCPSHTTCSPSPLLERWIVLRKGKRRHKRTRLIWKNILEIGCNGWLLGC